MINIQNSDDNEYSQWCLVGYLNPANRNPPRIIKADKDFGKKLDFTDIKFTVKVTFKKLKKRILLTLVFLVMRTNKNTQSTYQKTLLRKTCWFIINRRKRKETLCFYQRFQYFHVLSYFTPLKKKNIFVVIVYKLLVHKKYYNAILKTPLKLMINKKW